MFTLSCRRFMNSTSSGFRLQNETASLYTLLLRFIFFFFSISQCHIASIPKSINDDQNLVWAKSLNYQVVVKRGNIAKHANPSVFYTCIHFPQELQNNCFIKCYLQKKMYTRSPCCKQKKASTKAYCLPDWGHFLVKNELLQTQLN